MNALQNRHPNSNPNPTLKPYPNPITAPLSNPKPLTFDQVSKFFSLPLSDAADSLGVCTSVLKKICHDNGLVRWPYRKFLSGKSIEQIKEDAARAKNKQLNEVPKDAGRVSDPLANSSVPLLPGIGIQLHNKTSSESEVSRLQSDTQQQGNKKPQIGNPQKLHGSNLIKGTSTNLDEFKYGFPSDGLSSVSYKWWGNSSSDGSKDSPGVVSENIQRINKSPINSADGNNTIAPPADEEKNQNKIHESNINSLGEGLFSSLRKRAADEGRDALKLGVYRGFAMNKLDRTKRSVLEQIFKSSLPSEWGDDPL